MINIQTGSINITPDGPIIDPSMTEVEFRKLDYDMDRWEDRFQVNYKKYRDIHYTLEGLDSKGNSFELFITFSKEPNDKNPRLSSVLMNHFPNLFIDNELKALSNAKRWHSKWLKTNFKHSPEIKFHWGSISSIIEIKTPAAYIVVDYKRKKD